jgi:hypothetical protein
MFMCVVNLKSVNKLDLTWKQSFLINLKPFLIYLQCIVHREYFSIIFNVKKCALYLIKYGRSNFLMKNICLQVSEKIVWWCHLYDRFCCPGGFSIFNLLCGHHLYPTLLPWGHARAAMQCTNKQTMKMDVLSIKERI